MVAVSGKKADFERFSKRIESLLPLSRDQQSLNRISNDLEGATVPSLEEVVLWAANTWTKDHKMYTYDIFSDLSARPAEATSTNFLSLKFNNKRALEIVIFALMETAYLSLPSDCLVL